MKRLTIISIIVCLWGSMLGATRVNLDSLYRVLDATIDSADVYLQRKNHRIDSLKALLLQARDDEERMERTKAVYHEYIPGDNDSAIVYQYRCVALAEKMGRSDLRSKAMAQLAYQLANSGFYNEARIHFAEVRPQDMDNDEELTVVYLSGMNHLYGEMGFYTHDPQLKERFYAYSDSLRNALLARVDSTTTSWYALRSMVLNNSDNPQEALRFSDRWRSLCKPNTREYAIMAFYRSEIYKKLEDVEMQRYWLTQSAITDIRNAIMDQGALWSLANSLIRDNDDLDRAHNYIDFSWQCLTRFSTHMRSWLVAPVVTKINQEYKERLQATNQRLWWLIAVISLLAVIILLSLVYVSKKRKQLATARERLASLNTQLSTMNNELSETNKQLSDTNEQLRHAIIHLNDSNRVKDEYIGKFLSICSEYIDKLDNYRIKINRKLKANQHTDLLRMTGSEQLKEDELKELYDNFDTVFLHLFPTFINDFNALLRPEDRIVPTGKSLLNTDLRIFALIRLGIDESSKIAEFLHYSPNSIYAYRARIKNKAAGNREDFEQLVKEIGIYE